MCKKQKVFKIINKLHRGKKDPNKDIRTRTGIKRNRSIQTVKIKRKAQN